MTRASSSSPSSSLPTRPNLGYLKKLAKQRLRAMRRDDEKSSARFAEAQLAIAREYGFASWRALKAHVDSISHVAATVADEVGGLGVQVDVANEASVEAMYRDAAERFGGIDVLYNNAGISPADDG